MYKAAYLLKHRSCDSSDNYKLSSWKISKNLLNIQNGGWMSDILNSLNAHNLPIFQPILMILVLKFMVYRALFDKTYLLLGLLSP